MQTLDLFNGKKIIAYDNNDFISNTISQFKCWEPNVTDTFIQILKKYKTPTVFDVGCNIGYFSLISSDQCDKIFSFDSNEKNIDFLTKSIKINKINNIQPITCCVSDETNLFYKMQDTNDTNIGALKMVSCGKEDTDVTTIVLDDFIEKNNIQEVSILKIDIEGFELK